MASSALVETVYGPVVGFDEPGFIPGLSQSIRKVPVRKFLGVPYGQAERWKRVEPPTPWKEPLVCNEFGPSFPQFPFTPFDNIYPEPILAKRQSVQSDQKGFTVNIFSSPDIKEGDNVPVMVRALLHGCSSVTTYDPTEWVRREASKGRKFIVVTGNIRTNLVGFLASNDLIQEDPDGLAGNYGKSFLVSRTFFPKFTSLSCSLVLTLVFFTLKKGAYDCIALFKWIQQNIAKFGGDSDNVTAFGESAGAFLLAHLMLCKEKLFRRVILQSGALQTSVSNEKTAEEHEKVYEGLLQRASIKAESGAERLKALRALPIEELVQHLSMSVREVGMVAEDGRSGKAIWSEGCALSRLRAGEWGRHIESVMIGVVKDEGSLLCGVMQSHTAPGYELVRHEFLADVPHQTLGPLYDFPDQPHIDNPSNPADPFDFTRCSGSLAVADKLFNVPAELLVAALDGAKNAQTQKPLPVFLYKLDATAAELMPPGRVLGVPHTIDVVLLFNMCQYWGPESESARVSATLGKTWYEYARDGRPAGNWPEYQRQRSPYRLVFHQDGGASLEDLGKRSETDKRRMKFWADHLQLGQFWLPPPPVTDILN
ncbi:hypothetical protein VP01_77g5 [Puccinia sorghi]|uniref:Carboxylesterase type B domain-containing protein n=1 Tax=Puccinia sorghi TaxID=27349 RepID=A0A0L6UB91_9BASI|nr:hypothetical protein VP01_77g5 [Puccinia sorghi]